MAISGAEAVRRAVYATLVETGRGPSVDELAAASDRSADAVRADLRRLADAHAVVLTASGDAVRMAHPFSAAPMGFVVAPVDGRDDRLWWGGCAWDSFGMSAAMGLDVVIMTSCPACGRRHQVTAGPQRPPDSDAVVRFAYRARSWWDDVVRTCSSIRLFCTAEHAAAHAAAADHLVPIETVWRLAQPWYSDRLRPDYQPHSREQNQRLLAEVGLTGDFWELP